MYLLFDLLGIHASDCGPLRLHEHADSVFVEVFYAQVWQPVAAFGEERDKAGERAQAVVKAALEALARHRISPRDGNGSYARADNEKPKPAECEVVDLRGVRVSQ